MLLADDGVSLKNRFPAPGGLSPSGPLAWRPALGKGTALPFGPGQQGGRGLPAQAISPGAQETVKMLRQKGQLPRMAEPDRLQHLQGGGKGTALPGIRHLEFHPPTGHSLVLAGLGDKMDRAETEAGVRILFS